MKHPRKISVVIPAFNEEAHIARAVDSVAIGNVAIKGNSAVAEIEVIVVANGCTDRTAEIAEAHQARVLAYPQKLGYSGARNAGAAAAEGDILVFLDADSFVGPGTLGAIAAAWQKGASLGTVRGRPDEPRILHSLIFFFRNLGHILHIYRGVMGGLLFCDAALFRRVGGYRLSAVIDEHYDLIARLNAAGGSYAFLFRVAAYTSMRRHNHHGLARIFMFWLKVWGYRLGWLRQAPAGVGYGETDGQGHRSVPVSSDNLAAPKSRKSRRFAMIRP